MCDDGHEGDKGMRCDDMLSVIDAEVRSGLVVPPISQVGEANPGVLNGRSLKKVLHLLYKQGCCDHKRPIIVRRGRYQGRVMKGK